MFKNSVERTILVQEFERRFVAHTADSRYIVARVAGKGQIVQHERRGNSPVFFHAFRGNEFPAAGFTRFEHGHGIVHQLHEVLVAGKDDALPVFVPASCGEGRDDVVGLESVLTNQGDAECRENFLNDRNLRVKVFRSFLAGGLVFVIHFMTGKVGVGESKAATKHSGLYWEKNAWRFRKNPNRAETFFPSLLVRGLLIKAK